MTQAMPAAPSRHSSLRLALAASCLGAGLLGGVVAQGVQAERYVATTSVLVLPTAGGRDVAATAGRGATDVEIETEAQVAGSAQVAQAAADALGPGTTAPNVLDRASVRVPPNTQVLELTYSADTAEGARDGSLAVAEAYLERRSAAAAAGKAEVVAGLESQLAELDRRLSDVAAAIAAAEASQQLAQRTLAEAERSVLIEQIAEVNRRLAALRYQTTTGGEIITPATAPEAPASPKPLLYLGGGLALGLLSGAGVLFAGTRPVAAASPPAPPTSSPPVPPQPALDHPAGRRRSDVRARRHDSGAPTSPARHLDPARTP